MPVKDSLWTVTEMESRRVRYADLRACYNAFIDTRTPGSEAKENFTIIGPGVSENPEQFVHIEEPHGFNIGGARQPPGCVNSQHSHKTAEVFVIHKGKWRFDLGENGDDAQVVLDKGDAISIPTNIFRGFTNVGEDLGFLWAVLGEDDPGRVTWAPDVFEMAKDFGLVLLETGQLIDTGEGQSVPDGAVPMQPTSAEEVAGMTRVTQVRAEELVWRHNNAKPEESLPLICRDGFFSWPHGFTMERIILAKDSASPGDNVSGSKVIFIQEGSAVFCWDENELCLAEGDTLSVPRNLTHSMRSKDGAELFVVREGDESL